MDDLSKSFRYELKEDYFTCPICCENWLHRDPRILPCQHTFCKECLNELELKNKTIDFLCPICRTVFYWPEEGADGLTRNLIAWNILSISKEKNDNLDVNNNVSTVCIEHKSEILFFCRQCWNVPVCKECWNDHKDHDLKPWFDCIGQENFLLQCNTVIEDLKKRMETSINSLNNDVNEIEKKLPELKKKAKIVSENFLKKEEAKIELLFKKYSIIISKFEKISNSMEAKNQLSFDVMFVNLLHNNLCLILIIISFPLILFSIIFN